MKKTSLVLLAALLVALSVSTTYLLTYHAVYQRVKEEYVSGKTVAENSEFSKFLTTVSKYNDLYIREKDLDYDEINETLIRCYLAMTGDLYNEYYTPEMLEELLTSMDGKLVGIGVVVAQDPENSALVILAVADDSPAAEAGLVPGDAIVGVQTGNGQKTIAEIGLSNASSYVRGEAGTTVDLTVRRTKDGETTEEILTVTRREVTVTKIISKIYDEDSSVGIVRILEFDNTTPGDFRKAVDSLLAAGCTRLVVDVRNNPGGLRTSIEAVLDMILPEGPLIRTIDKNGVEEILSYSSANAPYQNLPIVVLVNESTASAAELFASALQDYATIGKIDATIVGVQTYGKGSMQSIVALEDGSAIKATNYYYCPPFSPNYDGVGVTPDIVVELSPELQNKNLNLIPDREDNQLTAGVASFFD